VGDRRGAYRVLVRRLEGKRSLGRPRCRWETNIENIKIDLQEGRWGGFERDSFGPGEGQVAGTCESSSEPSGSIKCRELLD
jgi:hypothetical protein